MQLIITHKTEPELVLPINYHHILQSIIFKAIEKTPEYEKNIHDYGYENGKRIYKLFQFSLLKGKYKIEQKNIITDSFSSHFQPQNRDKKGKLALFYLHR